MEITAWLRCELTDSISYQFPFSLSPIQNADSGIVATFSVFSFDLYSWQEEKIKRTNNVKFLNCILMFQNGTQQFWLCIVWDQLASTFRHVQSEIFWFCFIFFLSKVKFQRFRDIIKIRKP